LIGKPESLTKDHILDGFDCGKEALSIWLKKYALQSQNSSHTKTMVVTEGDSKNVIGYYTFNVVSIEHSDSTPERVKKGLAKHSIPVFLIARLAVASSHQGKGLGARLLRHALISVAYFSDEIPIRAVIVDALDEDAKLFYEKFDFEAFPPDTMRMWLLAKDLLKTLRESTDVYSS
jgi:predicted N-acetyltransferase YhbS